MSDRRHLLERLRETPIRAVVIARAHAAPVGARRLTDHSVATRLEPILGMIAHGHIPLDQDAAEGVGVALHHLWKTRAHENGK